MRGPITGLAVLLATNLAWAAAHSGEPPAPHDLWEAWNLSPLILVGLALPSVLYWRGYTRAPRAAVRPWQALCFLWGILTLQVALVSPLDALGSSLLTAHMVQHLLLLVVSPPLLVLASPGYVMLWALPIGWRKRVALAWHRVRAGWAIRPLGKVLLTPVGALLAYGAVTWLWHAPVLYQSALEYEALHVLEHLTFIAAAYLFWWVLLSPLARLQVNPGVGVAVLFGASVQGSALGALMAFSPAVWYPVYAATTPMWGVDTLVDQQLAGLVMWMPVGTVFVLMACALMWSWLRASDLSERRAAGTRVPAPSPGGD